MFLTISLITIVLCLIVAYPWNLKTQHEYFKRRGLSGPPPVFLFGHYLTIWSTHFYSRQLEKWTKQYGSVYGLFRGSRPMYVVSDVDFLQEVYIKQFASFHSRHLPFVIKQSIGQKTHILGAVGATWRRQRHVINPTFSTAKLKLMSPLVHHYIQSLMNKLAEKKEEFNIYVLYKRLTMDAICRCAFGMETDMQNDVDNMFLRKSQATVDLDLETLALVKFANLFPFLVPLAKCMMISRVMFSYLFRKIAPAWFLPQIEESPRFWIINHVDQIIKIRTSNDNQSHSIDLLQLMLDASTKEAIHDDADDESKKLHHDEVGINVFFFMIAGYETTSTALASCTYILATKPDIQDKLQAEVDEQEWNDDNQTNYDLAMNMNYLDLFVREVLRMYPIVPRVTTRECNTVSTICGHQIEKGSIIQPDVFTVHYDSNLWGPEDPNIFYPERHLTKRHPAAYMPFGIGPRNCVGMRFALMELKMCLVEIIRQYRILPGEKIEQGFQFDETFVNRPSAVYIKLEKR